MGQPTRFYDDPAYGVLQRMTMGKAADAALGSAFAAQTVFDRKTFMTGVTVLDANLEVHTGATCTGTGGVATEVWTLKVGKSAAGTAAITAIGTATVGTAGQANGTVIDMTVTETDFADGDDLVFYTDAGTALGDNSLVARASVEFMERYTS
jgi:hypothetical protein